MKAPGQETKPTIPPIPAFYLPDGTLRPDAPCYVNRRADDGLYATLSASELCYVLTSRPIGKSLLMARPAARLRREGCAQWSTIR